MADAERRILDAASLPGLAHPLRVQLLDQLTLYGPATATQLGGRLHESSGATSYHLRQLERYGFVEEDPARGSGRERWWRRVPGGLTINTPGLYDDVATREATTLVVKELWRGRQTRLERWRATFETWDRDWQDASSEGTYHLHVTPAELRALSEEIEALVLEWRQRTDAVGADRPDAQHVEVQVSTFPLPNPDGVG